MQTESTFYFVRNLENRSKYLYCIKKQISLYIIQILKNQRVNVTLKNVVTEMCFIFEQNTFSGFLQLDIQT